jgi:hypothetical protein
MTNYNATFEIHVHSDLSLRSDVVMAQVEDALRPLWSYSGAKTLSAGAASSYEEEPGIIFDVANHELHICWTVSGEEDFRHNLDDLCMALNDLVEVGGVLEVTFYDSDFDEEDQVNGRESRDDFVMLFVGPTPAAIMQVQRDMLIEDVVHLMERHFDSSELSGVVEEIDKLFGERFANLVQSLEIGKPPRGRGGSDSGNSHGGGRKPRHLH